MATLMHAAWQIAPSPALFLPDPRVGAVQGCEPNAAAFAWSVTAGWSSGRWALLAAMIGDEVDGSGCGLAWRVARVDGGRLAWLLAAEMAAPSDDTPSRELDRLRRQLSELTERLDLAQEFGRIGIWERDPVTGISRWDEHCLRLVGLEPAAGTPELAGLARCIHPDDRERVERVIRASLTTPGRHDCHFRVVQPGGKLMHAHSLWRVGSAVDGQPQQVIGILVDDTDHLSAVERDRRSLQQLTLAAGLAGISLWHVDLATQRIRYNDYGYRLGGFAPDREGIPLERVRADLHPDDVDAVVREAAQAVATGEVIEGRARYRDRTGRYISMLTRRVAQYDAQGRAVAVLGVSVNRTEQEDARARGDAFSARIDLVAEATGIGVWSIDLASRERHWNGQMRRLFGVPEHEAPPSLRERLNRVVVDDDRTKVADMVARIEAAGTRVLAPGQASGEGAPGSEGEMVEMVEVEFRIRLGDGPLRWLVSRTQVLRQGRQALAHGVVIDVSEFRATQVALRFAQNRVDLAAHAAGLGTWELDIVNQRHLWDAQMYVLRGLMPDDPRSIPELIRSLPPPDDDPQVDARVAEAMKGGGYSNEFRVRWPDGSVHWLASRGMTVTGPDGTVQRIFGINWDITEHKRADQMRREKLMAEEASRAKSEFLARMSHELRTPLNAVLGFAELLCAAPPARIGSQERAHAELIRSAGRHLLALIDDVLDLARIDAARLPLASEPVALDAVLSDVVRWVQAEARAAAVAVQAAASALWVRGDAKSLRQVFANLLSNGIKYNRPGGWVRVHAAASGEAWTLVRVVDTGRGLGAEQLAHLFEPFNRLGAEHGEIQGTGIGLAIVQQLVERMGGRIEVRSSPGQGAEFSLWLPRALETGPPLALATQQVLGRAPGSVADGVANDAEASRWTALYIEDNPVNLLLVRELFARKPAWRLHGAVTGAEGIAEALRLRPQLSLIDMQLPDMDGAEVLARLRSEPTLHGMRCIALSANAMPDDVLRARAAGFDDYWTKPIDFAGFLTALDALAASAVLVTRLAEPAD